MGLEDLDRYESLPEEQRKEVWELHDARLQKPEKCHVQLSVAKLWRGLWRGSSSRTASAGACQ